MDVGEEVLQHVKDLLRETRSQEEVLGLGMIQDNQAHVFSLEGRKFPPACSPDEIYVTHWVA